MTDGELRFVWALWGHQKHLEHPTNWVPIAQVSATIGVQEAGTRGALLALEKKRMATRNKKGAVKLTEKGLRFAAEFKRIAREMMGNAA